MTIGEKIRALRIERGMSQNDLALACGYVSRASINKIELGKVDLPQSKIKAIASALDVSPAALILDEGLFSDQSPDVNELMSQFVLLSPQKKKLLDLICQIPDEKAAQLLRIFQSVLEYGEES